MIAIPNLRALQGLAGEKLPPMAFDYYSGGADDEITLRENEAAYGRIRILPHMLVDVSVVERHTTVLGRRVAMPVLAAPTAFHGLAHPDGELATARAAAEAGTIFVLSTLSNTDVEAVVPAYDAAAGPGAPGVWFQLYLYKDRAATRALVERVEAAGCRALVLTVDAPVIGRRERDEKNRFGLPAGLTVRNMVAHGYGTLASPDEGSGLAHYVATMLDTSQSWKDVEWLAGITRLPIVVKGILRASDGRRAKEAGVAALVVSNHGGRQLDGVPATIDALEPIVAEVGAELEVLVDGGVRRGTDVLKALALGARAVLVGRPLLWGLALGGQAGARAVYSVLERELVQAMMLSGVPTIGAIRRDLVKQAWQIPGRSKAELAPP
jgi:4-hydroxymandelate oxidase